MMGNADRAGFHEHGNNSQDTLLGVANQPDFPNKLRRRSAGHSTTHDARRPVPLESTKSRSLFKRIVAGKKDDSDYDFHVSSAAYNVLSDEAEQQFFDYLDKELEKITTFYNQKEQAAKERLMVLEYQIEIMTKNREWIKSGQGIKKAADSMPTITLLTGSSADIGSLPVSRDSILGLDASRRDYTRKPAPYEDQIKIPYKDAKRKIKIALLEYYKGLELMKAYTALNREGFRKILKKYDKIAQRRMASKYMRQKNLPFQLLVIR